MNLTKKFLWTWKAVGGPRLTPEYRFHPMRKWRFDFASEAAAVAIELEGGIWIRGRHNSPKGFMADLEKYNEAAYMGWTVIRITDDQINVPMMERLANFVKDRSGMSGRSRIHE